MTILLALTLAVCGCALSTEGTAGSDIPAVDAAIDATADVPPLDTDPADAGDVSLEDSQAGDSSFDAESPDAAEVADADSTAEGGGDADAPDADAAPKPSLGSDKATYTVGSPLIVYFVGFPAKPKDWIAIAPAGAPDSAYAVWSYTGGVKNGSVLLSAPGPGTYEARGYVDDSTTRIATSATFTVGP